MKVNFTHLAAFTLVIGVNYSAFSQTWDRIGNNILATDYLGTNNNQPLRFFTNNTERMRLTQTGFLGIGITAPTSVLHINKINTGEMFKTNGDGTLENRWRLYTTEVSAVEQFRLYVPSKSSNVFLQAQQATGNLHFNIAGGTNTAYPDTKLRIFPDDTDRMVAFESPFTSGFTPSYNAKFIINDRNNPSSATSLVDDALLLRVQGVGKILPGLPAALPIASGEGFGNFTLAEIISKRENVGDLGNPRKAFLAV